MGCSSCGKKRSTAKKVVAKPASTKIKVVLKKK
jgi:hypothetical protein